MDQLAYDPAPRAGLSRRFRLFVRESHTASLLYSRLAPQIAGDEEILDLAARATSGPVPNLLFAAVHYLLLGDTRHPLADFYASVSGVARHDGDPFPLFRSFCLEQSEEIEPLLRTRRVQTNEVRRSAVLLPAFGIVARRAGKPLALVEIGASAGLNLLFDRYAYDYGNGQRIGYPDSPVQITCELRGLSAPLLPLPEVASSVGVDLAPVDVRDPAAVAWLEALIWPEEFADRAPLRRRAVGAARPDPPPVKAGDALEWLPDLLENLPDDVTPCVFHTFAVNQFSDEARENLITVLSEQAARRELFRISLEFQLGDKLARMHLASLRGSTATEVLLARCNGHATFMEWLGSSD